MQGELQLSFFLCGERRPRTVTDVENAHKMFTFVYRVDNSVGVWLLPKKRMAKFLAFRNDCTALGKSLQRVYLIVESLKLPRGVERRPLVNVLE